MNPITDLGRFIVEIIGFVWPLRIVWGWELGAYYICGRYWCDVGPGCWPMIPFFMDVRTDGVVSQTVQTPLQTITTKDGGTLTFSASLKLRVLRLGQAYGTVLQWDETAVEDASAALADKLAEVEIRRLEPAERGKLLAVCKALLDKEVSAYGLAIDKVRFVNFVRNMPVYRLFNDQTGNAKGD